MKIAEKNKNDLSILTYKSIYKFIMPFFAFLTISCTNTTTSKKQQDVIDISNTINSVNNGRDTLLIQQDSILNNRHEEPDSLTGWEEIAPGLGLYYKRDVMLTIPIVDVVNAQLRMYLSDYIVPLVKRKGFDYKKHFIFVSYITDKSALIEEESARIDILVDYCGITYRIARDIYEGKYQVAFIDGIPIMFEDFKAKGFIRATSQIFEFRKWKNFIWLMTCELETNFFFSVVDGDIKYRGYEDWGLNLVRPDSKLPEVWNPEQKMPETDMPSDLVAEDGDSISTKLINEEPDTIN